MVAVRRGTALGPRQTHLDTGAAGMGAVSKGTVVATAIVPMVATVGVAVATRGQAVTAKVKVIARVVSLLRALGR